MQILDICLQTNKRKKENPSMWKWSSTDSNKIFPALEAH